MDPAAARDVVALVLVAEHDEDTAIDRTLDSVDAQTRRPAQLLVVLPLGRPRPHLDRGDGRRPDMIEAATAGLAGAVDAALAHLDRSDTGDDDPDPDRWLWLLPVGADPGRGALAAQLARRCEDDTLAALGAKQLRPRDEEVGDGRTADDADGLVDVGVTLTHGGRIVSGVEAAEIDQGQSDWRREVLGVGLPALLVAERALRRAGGFDPALDRRWAPIELCHRLWRDGSRVEVVAPARALAVPDPDGRSARSLRSGSQLTALAVRPAPLAVLTLVLLPLTTVLRALLALTSHRSRAVRDELSAARVVVRRGPGVIARSARAARHAVVPRRHLAPLFLSRREELRRRASSLWTRTVSEDDRSRRIRRTTWGISGTSHGADDADFGRHTAWTLALAVLALGGTLLTLRGLLGAGRLRGPALVSLPEDWHDTWQAAWSDWIPGGLGHAGPADPLIRVLAHVPVPGGAIVEAIVLGAIPASTLAAWWAAGALTRAVGARLVLAAVWGLAPPLLGALSEGRWPLLLVHALLPLLALAVGRAVGLPHKASQASVSGAAAAGLLLLVIGAVQPVLVLLAALALALIAPSVPGRRGRLLWALAPSIALHAPYVAGDIGAPRLLLAVGGQNGAAATPESAGSVLGALSLAPTAGWTAWGGAMDAGTAHALPYLLLLPVALAALVAPFLAADAGRAGRLGMALAGLALAAAVLCTQVPVGLSGARTVTAPPHALVSVALLGALLGAGCTFDALARRDGQIRGGRRALTAVCAAVLAGATVALVAGWALALPSGLHLHRDGRAEVPAAAADQGRSSARERTLVLGAPSRSGVVSARLVVGGGEDVLQDSARVQSRALTAATRGAATPGDAADRALLTTSAELLAGTPDATGVQDLAIGSVVVPADASGQDGLVAALDASPQLERVTRGDEGSLWRVVDARPRATLDAAGTRRVILASEIVDVHGDVPRSDTARVIELAERHDGSWRARVGDTDLDPVRPDGWRQGFVVPPGVAGHLDIRSPAPAVSLARPALWAVTILTAIVAVPRRGRPIRTEGS